MSRILFIKLGAIGDVIQAAVAVERFKLSNPNVLVDWVVGQSISGLLESLKVADKVIAVPEQALLTGPLAQRIKALLISWFLLLSHCQKYKAIYIAHTNWQYDLFALPAYACNPRLIFQMQKRFFPATKEYRVSEYLKFLSGNTIDVIEGASILQGLGNRLLSNNLFKQSFFEKKQQRKTVALVSGGSRNALRDDFLRRWPIERYVELAKLFISADCEVVLVGANSDQWVKSYFEGLRTIDLIGKSSLLELVAVLDKADLIITHDTGPLHLATLTSTPLITLFGPTPATAVAPVGRQNLRVFKASKEIVCAPCYDGKNYADCSNPICMKSISVDKVFAASQNLLKNKASL
ncbi:glycosyltransferase family 9 protein [Polynucleobacter sp. MWH-HuK1]|uniref:glycosyltransferase family 9 protein n=1 Tax=Polynucleobacter sp. MWH-HuK1 TaxID=1743158 RepID=UPI001C0AE07C|nr:glycosyltransferase family 9 protein [Polynucleobacter sp. MWH-HuK1]MBU3564470.1 glycosyltransferase family 9 protein [Polynucleobacter sp. MWH-HuK1]